MKSSTNRLPNYNYDEMTEFTLEAALPLHKPACPPHCLKSSGLNRPFTGFVDALGFEVAFIVGFMVSFMVSFIVGIMVASIVGFMVAIIVGVIVAFIVGFMVLGISAITVVYHAWNVIKASCCCTSIEHSALAGIAQDLNVATGSN